MKNTVSAKIATLPLLFLTIFFIASCSGGPKVENASSSNSSAQEVSKPTPSAQDRFASYKRQLREETVEKWQSDLNSRMSLSWVELTGPDRTILEVSNPNYTSQSCKKYIESMGPDKMKELGYTEIVCENNKQKWEFDMDTMQLSSALPYP